jgi:putative heme transporter
VGCGRVWRVARNGRGWRRAVVAVVGLAAATLAGWVLYNNSDELFTAADTLKSVQAGWVVVAVLIEVLSYLARGASTAMVLRRGGGGAGPVTLSAAVLAGDAAAYCLPLGFAASGVVMVGVLRRRQVSTAVAGWMFAVASVFYVGSITALTIIAVPIAGDDDPVPGLQGVSAVLLGVLVVGGGVGYALLRRPTLRSRLSHLIPRVRLAFAARLGGSQRRWSRLVQSVSTPLKSWLAQLRTVRLTLLTGAAAFVLMMVSWVADVAVLAVAFMALGSSPPWTGLLLAYCAGQIAASLPITPGGIGVVEGSITLALVAFGGAETITLTAVLLYRLIAYWGCIPAGGLAWLALRATSRAPAGQGVSIPEQPVATEVAEAEPLS